MTLSEREHVMSEEGECWCSPEIDDGVLIHNFVGGGMNKLQQLRDDAIAGQRCGAMYTFTTKNNDLLALLDLVELQHEALQGFDGTGYAFKKALADYEQFNKEQ